MSDGNEELDRALRLTLCRFSASLDQFAAELREKAKVFQEFADRAALGIDDDDIDWLDLELKRTGQPL